MNITNEDNNEYKKGVNRLVKTSKLLGGMTGSLAGAIVGLAIGGLPGAIIGASTSQAFAEQAGDLLSSFTQQILSSGEIRKVDDVVYFTIQGIEKRLGKEKPRADIFSQDDNTSSKNEQQFRTAAEEIFEGILFAAKNEHEEKKS